MGCICLLCLPKCGVTTPTRDSTGLVQKHKAVTAGRSPYPTYPYGHSAQIKNNTVSRGGPNEPFFAIVYVDDFIMARVQADPTDQMALLLIVASASLASDHSYHGPEKEHGLGHHHGHARFYGQHSHTSYSGAGRKV